MKTNSLYPLFCCTPFFMCTSHKYPLKHKRGIEKWISLFNASFVCLYATKKLLIRPMLMRGRASRSPSSVNRPGVAAEAECLVVKEEKILYIATRISNRFFLRSSL